MNTDDDDLFEEWTYHLHIELEGLRDRRLEGQPKENDGKNTLDKLAQYSNIISTLKQRVDIMEFYRIFVTSLVNRYRKGNVVEKDVTLIRPCQLWEYFAAFYFQYINVSFLPVKANLLTVSHQGGRNDKGADVICEYYGGKIVVQAKRGKFFANGKGNEIVQRLVGALFYHKTNIGIIFTNELSESVKTSANEIIQNAREHKTLPMYIHVLGWNELINEDQAADPYSYRKLMVDFMTEYFR